MTNLEVIEDWRYSEDRMELRRYGLTTFLKEYGSALDQYGQPQYSNQSMYECVHDWVSQGNVNCLGISDHYKKYYA